MDISADRRDMLSRFLETKHLTDELSHSKNSSWKQARFVGAGSDTTGISLRAIFYVITNPEVYAKLMDE
jgi:hypothetical protein